MASSSRARGPCPRLVELAHHERVTLEALEGRYTLGHAVLTRIRIVLALADGLGPTAVARRFRVSDRLVRKWRERWEEGRTLQALHDAPRSGAPATFELTDRCELIKLACDRPDGLLVPLRNVWTQLDLTTALRASTNGRVMMSRSTAQRVLASAGLRPHRVRQWLHSPDPDFRAKVERVCDLYLHPPEGAVVLCVDEKPLQAIERIHRQHRGRDATVRHEYEYTRHGTGALLAAFNIRTGKVHTATVAHRDSAALSAFLDEVVAAYPKQRIIIVWDNLNLHYDGPTQRWRALNERHDNRVEFVYTPLHASWVNQVEVWFSILQRRVIRHGSFGSVRRLFAEVDAFARHWNRREAKPFRWKFNGRFHDPPRQLAA